MVAVSIQYRCSEQDYNDFFSGYLKARIRKPFWLIIVAWFAWSCLQVLNSSHPARVAPLYLIVFLVCLALIVVFVRALIKSRAKKIVRSLGPEFFETPKSLTLTEDGIEYRTVFETTQYVLRAIEKISRDDRFVIITLRGNLRLLVPTWTPGIADFYNALLAKMATPQPQK